MRKSRLAPGGGNVLQKVRVKRAEALHRGQTLFDLSIGEPKGPALASARAAAQVAIASDDEAMHAYQYNASPGVPGFSERFIAAHVPRSLAAEDVAYLPIPGIKPILGLLPLSCGCANGPLAVATMTSPGYPIPADWCEYHPYVTHSALRIAPDNAFRFVPDDIPSGTGLIMMNYPHNPSGQVASAQWLSELCAYCATHDIRLFNDAAYCVLTHTDDSATLCEVAPDHPELSWCEAFTAAKLIGNGTGWHVGAMVGSSDFIADLAEVKGKTDTGFVAPMAVGALAALETDQAGIAEVRAFYRRQLDTLCGLMLNRGMRLAQVPQAGFFTLWQTPDVAFGEEVQSAEHFNFRMIDETGVVGVHFGDYLRYAVCADVGAMTGPLSEAFDKAAVSYRD
jgi:aspartate/methionine/tyrosine aminotransferase